MFLLRFDFLSPSNSVHFNRKERRASIMSGILSILSILGVIGVSIPIVIDLIKKKKPVAYFYNKYYSKVGIFPFNSSSMFNFVTVGYKKIDFRAITIFSTEKYITDYVEDSDLSEYKHWIHGECDPSDLNGLEYDNMTLFQEGACIREYWDVTKQKYIKKGEDGFIWPEIQDVAQLARPYGLYIEKCRNNSGPVLHRDNCHEESIINQYIKESVQAMLYFIDHYIDVGNYTNPAINTFYKFSTGIFEGNVPVNHLNYNPVKIRTNKGWLTDKIVEETSFMFSQNEKMAIDDPENKILSIYYFWMQNNVQVYERAYEKVQEMLGNIGGMFQILVGAAGILNSLINEYQVLVDSVFLNVTHSEKTRKTSNNCNYDSNSKISLNTHNKKLFTVSHFSDNNKQVSRRQQPEKENSTIYENGPSKKKINNISFIEFLRMKYFWCCFKDKKRKKYIEHLLMLRQNIVSEEFLFKSYYNSFFIEKNDIEQKKNVFLSPEKGNQQGNSLAMKYL